MGIWRRCPVVVGVIESEVVQHDTGQKGGAGNGVVQGTGWHHLGVLLGLKALFKGSGRAGSW